VDSCTQAASGDISPEAAHQQLNVQLYTVLGIMAIGGLASGLRAYMFNSAAERVMCRLRVKLFSKVSCLLPWHCELNHVLAACLQGVLLLS
jgi:hypothetical protein